MRLLFVLLALLGLTAAGPARDWSRTVTVTPAGSYVLGNPRARVRLVEYLSYTCSHCAEFSRDAAAPLRDRYVRSGTVAVEFRHATRDALDVTAALLARCGTPAGFFARSEAIFAQQGAMFARVEAWQAANTMPTAMDAALPALANGSGLNALMTAQGVPPRAQAQCLASRPARAAVVAQTAEAWQTRRIPGTPAFLLDGQQLGGTWASLEPLLAAKVKP